MVVAQLHRCGLRPRLRSSDVAAVISHMVDGAAECGASYGVLQAPNGYAQFRFFDVIRFEVRMPEAVRSDPFAVEWLRRHRVRPLADPADFNDHRELPLERRWVPVLKLLLVRSVIDLLFVATADELDLAQGHHGLCDPGGGTLAT